MYGTSGWLSLSWREEGWATAAVWRKWSTNAQCVWSQPLWQLQLVNGLPHALFQSPHHTHTYKHTLFPAGLFQQAYSKASADTESLMTIRKAATVISLHSCHAGWPGSTALDTTCTERRAGFANNVVLVKKSIFLHKTGHDIQKWIKYCSLKRTVCAHKMLICAHKLFSEHFVGTHTGILAPISTDLLPQNTILWSHNANVCETNANLFAQHAKLCTQICIW